MTDAARPIGAPARNEALATWAAILAGLFVFKFAVQPLLPWALTGAVAVAAFLYAPEWKMRARGEFHADYGLNLSRWRSDLAHAAVTMAVVFPLFVLAFTSFSQLLQAIPADYAAMLAPYGVPHAPRWRLPGNNPWYYLRDSLLEKIAGNAAVAISEEFFYRGYLQALLERAWPASSRAPRLAGVPMGRAFFATAALFAVGHLVEPAPWRLGVFFPALLFGWLRGRTGTVAGAALVHGASNVFLAALEASVYG